MLKKVLIGFALATVAILLILWLATGGVGKVFDATRSIGNIFKFGSVPTGEFRLPWQPENPFANIDILDPSGNGTLSTEGELSNAEQEYEELLKKIEEAKTFGDPSPYRGQVHLEQGGAEENDPSAEYVILEAASSNTAPISLRGWSVQSALTGLRGYVPRGAHPFLMGAVNTQSDVYLDPGGLAIVNSGTSPAGTSFRENLCTGYLAELQPFTPSLTRSCPSPKDSFAFTPENIQNYGESCYDFVQTLSSCTFPREVPANLSPACHTFLANNFSYNGCVQNYRHTSGFSGDEWRLYLDAHGELWRNSHDIIRLLDAEGRTVDYISY